MWFCVLFQLMNQLWDCRKGLYMLDSKVKSNVKQHKDHMLSNPYIHLVYGQSYYFIEMEKCIRSFILDKKFKYCKPRQKEPIPCIASKWKTRTCHVLEFSDDPSCISQHLHTTQSWHQLSHLLLSVITPSQRRYIRKINREINTFYPSYQMCSGCLSC